MSNHADLADFYCYSPHLPPDYSRIVILSAPRSSQGRAASNSLSNNTTNVLRAAALENDMTCTAPVTLLDVVDSTLPGDFRGLYLHALPAGPWRGVGEELTVVAASVWGS